jgi:pimeloyl-ACP methyl ester carboxylesterase
MNSLNSSASAPVKNVHGAWEDGSSWSKIVPLLIAKGLHVACAQHPLTSIAEDVAATNRIIKAQDSSVLLVGHSYGGAIITVAGDNPKVAGLVYVAAFAPDKGETLAGLAQPFGPTPAFGEIRPIEDGFLMLTEDFAQDLTLEEHQLLFATQGATQGAILGTQITNAAWHSKPSWFVVATNDRTISPAQEQMTAERMGAQILSLPTSHVAMLAMPEAVADFIVKAAEGSLAVAA